MTTAYKATRQSIRQRRENHRQRAWEQSDPPLTWSTPATMPTPRRKATTPLQQPEPEPQQEGQPLEPDPRPPVALHPKDYLRRCLQSGQPVPDHVVERALRLSPGALRRPASPTRFAVGPDMEVRKTPAGWIVTSGLF